ncbi:MAG: C25 family cysteine peptidase [Kiritimatiellae bacterium]|nr:C25 family cysteine peptidase [Kiritimatiellia bacterium]
MRGVLQKLLCAGAALVALGARADAITGGSLSQTVSFPAPVVGLTPDGLTRVTLAGCEPDMRTAKPVLPVTGVSFEIPAGHEIATVTVTPAAVIEIPLGAPVEWGLPPRQPDDPPTPAVTPDPAVYNGNRPYPDLAQPAWRLDPRGGSPSLLSVPLYPVRFDPARNALLAATALTVSVQVQAATAPPKQGLLTAPLAFSALDPSESHTYVILSTSNLLYNAPPPWNFQTLCDARARAGFTPALVSTEWVCANYPGADTPARIRAFLQDARQQWGTRFLLIGGTYGLIPARKLFISVAEIFTHTTEIPADAIYYGCLDGPFDNNGNGLYGEVTDGANGGDIDLTAEIMVGRFPVANAGELAHMIRKTLRYEAATAQDVMPNAFSAEKMDLGTMTYAAGFMEELRFGSAAYGLSTIGFETSAYSNALDTGHTLYDSPTFLWGTADSLAFLNRNLGSLNHIGHASIQQCMKINLADTAHQNALRAFTNGMPYFAYSQSCSAGAFDTADCFAEQLVTVSNAAFASIMNAREGWVYNNTVGGFSHRYHRCFWDSALRGAATRLGEINEQSRLMNLHMINPATANFWRWEYYQHNLFGDPATPFVPAINTVPPAVSHEPLVNTYDTQTAYRVTCSLEPAGIYDPGAVFLLWHTSREPGLVHTQLMTQTSGNLFEAGIPPHPANTRIAYTLHAANHAGCIARAPGDGDALFDVTDRLDLEIRGSPFNFGTPDPGYGTHYYASGLVATASAPSLYSVSADTRYANRGFFGIGSVPQSGTNLTVSFRMDAHSLLSWVWQREYLLAVRCDLPGFPEQTLWIPENGTATPSPAPAIITNNGTAYAFAEWHRDGTRAPAAPAHSPPAFGTVTSDAPHTLTARYLPLDLDADTNSIPDWWEFQYYGANGQDPESDDDGDGYLLWEEYDDRTDPLLKSLIPAPPRITHTPLDEVQTRPGPFAIRAIITDSHEIASATVYWRRKTEAWQSTPMALVSNGLFEAQIGTVSAPADDFEYQIIAADPTGLTSQTGVFFFFLRYPVADTSRFHDLCLVALPTQTYAYAYMNLHNTGNADLHWSMRFSRTDTFRDTELRGWNRTSLGQPWEVSTNRAASPPYALHSRLVSNRLVYSPVRSTITLPQTFLGANAVLSFKYWIFSELDKNPARAYDGGIVEFSSDNGATFRQLRGPYTHTIYGWDASPWPDGTPCFAGNGTEGWQTATFDLLKEYPELLGMQNHTVIFRFHYGGDNNTDNEGWYIDDIDISPLQWLNGFSHSIEPSYGYTIAGGDFKRILWCNLPTAITDTRDGMMTVSLLSNDPVLPVFSFFWQLKIREAPLLPGLAAFQTPTGDGRVVLTTGVTDKDREPVSLAVTWSRDSGKTWSPAALTNLLADAGAIPPSSPSGTITGLPTSLLGVTPITNRLSSVWLSRAVTPPVSVCTQTLFRITASNAYYGAAYTAGPFTVDNVPPAFPTNSALTASPFSSVGPYALTTNLLTLAWPAATDTLSTTLSYRLVGAGSTHTAATVSATIPLSNALNATHAFQVTAVDPGGNASEPLTASFLVLDALGDYDGDGLSNAGEEIAGTSATNAAERFTAALSSGSGTLTLSWQGAAGRLYTVEATPTLLPPDWQPLPEHTDIPGTGEPLGVAFPATQPSCFFRIRVRLP